MLFFKAELLWYFMVLLLLYLPIMSGYYILDTA